MFLVQHSAVTDVNGTQTLEITKTLSRMYLWGAFINTRAEPLKQ